MFSTAGVSVSLVTAADAISLASLSGSTEISLSDAQANSGAKSLFVKGRTISWNGAGASMIGVMYPDQQYDLSVAVYYDDEVGGQNQQFNLQCLYTDKDGQHCILIDYKSFPGVNYSEHTQKYYLQLSAYAQALREAGIDVTHTLLYYPVGKVVHRML